MLWESEKEYHDKLENALYYIDKSMTLRDFLDLGFNNGTLISPVGDRSIKGFYQTKEDGKYCYNLDLTKEMLDVNVILSDTYEDADGYTCAYIKLENEKDWELFKEM